MAVELAGRRILVVEDEMLVAALIEDILIDEGCEVIGPHGTLAGARAAAEREEYDLALLDVNLRGDNSLPVALAVEARGKPFVLLSGYGADAVPAGRNWRAVAKPFGADQLIAAVRDGLG